MYVCMHVCTYVRMYVEELITWIAEWMNLGHDWWTWGPPGPVGRGRPCHSPSSRPRLHFGMDLASIFDTFWTFVHHLCFKTSTIEKTWIFIEIPWTNGALEPWKIQLLRGTL